MATAPQVTNTTVVPEVTEDDDFSNAFAEFSLPGEKTPAAGAAAAAAAETAATAAEATAAVVTPPAAVVTPPAADDTELEDLTPEEKAAAAAGVKPTPPASTITDREADMLEKFAKAMKPEPTRPQPQEQVQQEPRAAPLFSGDEAKFLTEFTTEWPDVARALDIRQRVLSNQIVAHIFTEVAKSLGPRLQMLEGLVDNQHANDLHTIIPDYDDVRDKVLAWVGVQPSYLKAAYERVTTEGTVDEVKDLIDRYRRDTGVAEKPSTSVAPAKTVTELSGTAKKAAAALAPVGSKRTAAVSATAPEDFDGAFAQFANL